MIIINADDWGRSAPDTDAAADLVKAGRVTSVSAMVFMADSERAARLADALGVDVGLHVNFCERFDAVKVPGGLKRSQSQLASFFSRGRYAQLLYNPTLRRSFRDVYEGQVEEFRRLYRQDPSHVDGHRHLHLCMNMLVDRIIPEGVAVRRSFTFASGEKGVLNRTFRRLVDARLRRRHPLTDAFFSIEHCFRPGHSFAAIAAMGRAATVEVMTHPRRRAEYEYLAGPYCADTLRDVTTGTYADLAASCRLRRNESPAR